jgi:6-phosphogluconolactonase
MTELLIGGYGADLGGSARGIGRARTTDDGRVEYLGVAAETESPSWVLVDGDRVLATLEGAGEVQEFVRSASGGLDEVARVPAGGVLPCHLALDGGMPVAACYGDGAVVAWPGGLAAPRRVLAGSGSGPLPVQEGPHAHHVLPLGDGRLLALDLGADLLRRLRTADGILVADGVVPLPPGTGPRDALALPDGRLLVLGEWSRELLLLDPDPDDPSGWRLVQTLALPGADRGGQAAGLALGPDATAVFAGIRGPDVVARVGLDEEGLRPLGSTPLGAEWPRHLLVDGDRLHVAAQLSNAIVTFAIGAGGTLEPVGAPTSAPSPTCMAVLRGLLS